MWFQETLLSFGSTDVIPDLIAGRANESTRKLASRQVVPLLNERHKDLLSDIIGVRVVENMAAYPTDDDLGDQGKDLVFRLGISGVGGFKKLIQQ